MNLKLLIGTLIAMTPGFVSAALSLKPQSKLWIEGDSTLHRWSSTSTTLGFQAESPQGALDKIVENGLVAGMKVTIPVASLQSGEKGLDKNMRKALKAEANPDIVFTMSGYKVALDPNGSRFVASGTLAIAGEKKEVSIEAPFRLENGQVVIDGQYPLLMTDYGVKPPTLMLGAIKVDNRVAVKFHLELAADESYRDATKK